MDNAITDRIRHFCSHFAGHEESFLLIGGSACSCWYAGETPTFRGTRDLDVVIVVESLRREFVDLLVSYLRDNGYAAWERHLQGGSSKRVMYRFLNPANPLAATQIELLSRSGEIHRVDALQHAVPIKSAGEYTGLSGIALDNAYYNFILTQRSTAMDCPVLSLPGIVMLKIKAFLNLYAAASADDRGKKHRNDVFFLLATIDPALYARPIPLAPALMEDVRAFDTLMRQNLQTAAAVRDSLHRRLGRSFAFSIEDLLSVLGSMFSLAEP